MADEAGAPEGQDFSEVENTPVEPVAEQTETNSDAAAEAAVASKMQEIFNRNDTKNQEDELVEEGAVSPDNPDGTLDPEAEGEHVADEEVQEDEEAEQLSPEEKAAADARKKTIDAFDPNLKRIAAELGGWKQSDIEDLIAHNPVLARVTFSNMAAGYNALSQQYAQAARSVIPAQQLQAPTVAAPAPSALDELLSNPEKFKALSEIAGDELMKGFIKPLLDERKSMLEDRQFIASLRQEALVREINDSFTDVAKDGFEEFYGKAGETTQEQQNNRFKVGQLADQIRAGAQLQRVNMPVKEAIRRAHLILTANQVKATARKEIVKQVQTRAKQLTLRPTARKNRAAAPVQKGEEAALAGVQDWWASREQ
jgi:hypothetical protein